MLHLEKQNCVHRDVWYESTLHSIVKILIETSFFSARNFLVTEVREGSGAYLVKLGDFGMARQLLHNQYNMNSGSIPVRWTAPEVLKSGTFTVKSDVYSFGGTYKNLNCSYCFF